LILATQETQYVGNNGGISPVKKDLVLIDQQSVGKRRLHLMDTFNAKRDGRPFTGVSTNS
jgi:hypothetical protein